MTGLATELAKALAVDGRGVIVAVASGVGSTPREAGAWMLVAAGGSVGAVGGGHLEFEAIRLAREALAGTTPAATWLVRYPLAARLGQCCGGVATVAIAVVDRGADFVDAAVACERTGVDYALIHRLGGAGDPAQRLLVTADDARGSLGSTDLDSAAVAAVRSRLASPGLPATGVVEIRGVSLFVHAVGATAFDVLVFGNGHVGRAVVQVLAALPCRVRWIDAREQDFPAAVPANVETVSTDALRAELHDAPRGAYVVVTTHSHALDFDVIEAALERDDWAYLGLIGSKPKRAQFEKRLATRGRPVADLTRVVCPIGTLAGLKSKEPGVIAVGIVAEILAIRQARAAGATGNTDPGRREAQLARGTTLAFPTGKPRA